MFFETNSLVWILGCRPSGKEIHLCFVLLTLFIGQGLSTLKSQDEDNSGVEKKRVEPK